LGEVSVISSENAMGTESESMSVSGMTSSEPIGKRCVYWIFEVGSGNGMGNGIEKGNESAI